MQNDQKRQEKQCKMIRRDGRNSHIWSWALLVTLTFKTANQAICTTIWSMMIYNYNIKSEYKRLSSSKDIAWTKFGHKDRWTLWFQYTDSFNCITLFIGDTSNQCSRLWLERTLEQRYTSAIIQDCRSSWCNEHAAVIQTELLSHLAQQVVCTLVSKHIRLITHSQHHFPAPSSKLCQI